MNFLNRNRSLVYTLLAVRFLPPFRTFFSPRGLNEPCLMRKIIALISVTLFRPKGLTKFNSSLLLVSSLNKDAILQIILPLLKFNFKPQFILRDRQNNRLNLRAVRK